MIVVDPNPAAPMLGSFDSCRSVKKGCSLVAPKFGCMQTLARGQLVDGVLSLLSKQELVKQNKDLTMQMSAIEAHLDVKGDLECSRFDVLIADKVHVATWGVMDYIKETLQMTLAIPGTTFIDVLGFSKTPKNYYLQVPISGTFEKPKVDWRSAGVGVAKVTAFQQGGQFMQGIFKYFENPEASAAPEPLGNLPWLAGR